jgi:hypothetical protein
VPEDERLGADDREDLQDRRKPSIQLDEEAASLFVSRSLPRTLRRKKINCYLTAAFSASSQLFDFTVETKIAKTKRAARSSSQLT